ncbi:MAG TPA: substrate-binding domain-containing protein [Steroidobacteraceae bacterium]|jgi:putative molybdopterin biosynthesis protein|nr:substrate-binding domain-containing protein [Steroidobacteraceae bacterium]
MPDTKIAAKGEPALGLHLRYAFEPGEQRGATLGNPLFDLLTAVLELGSIRHAAQSLGCSYRYVWGSLRKWEHMLGEPLIIWSQGQRARPTQFAERLLWAERRARTRMQPHIEALRSDLSRVVAEARDQRHQLLTVQASHDMALSVLQQHVASTADLHLDIRFQGSEDALRGLSDRQCLVAGFHVPALRGAAPVFAKALKPLLRPGRHKLIGCARRMQGLMVRREHAALIRTFHDVVRHRLRFVNRQTGSGTRMLIDHLLHEHSINPGDLPGYHGLTEETHVAVALCVASGLADAGVGVEAAALEFGLHFAPLVEENYFLACLKVNLGHAAVQRLCAALAGTGWKEILADLPGYQPALAPGKVLIMTEALPWWPKIKSRPKRSRTHSAPGMAKVVAEQLV